MNSHFLKYVYAQNREHGVHAYFESQPLSYNEQERVYCDDTPDLRVNRVGFAAEKCLNAKVHLDQLEEKFDLPTGFVEQGNGESGQNEIVRKKDQAFAGIGIDINDPAQLVRICGLGFWVGEPDDLVANHTAAFWHRLGVTDVKTKIGFGAGDKECLCFLNSCEPPEVDIAAVENIEAATFKRKLIEPVDVMHLSISDMDQRGDRSAQIQLRVDLDRRLGLSETSPREQRQAQIDGRRIDGKHDRRFEPLDVERLPDVEFARAPDKQQRKILVDAPVPRSVGLGKRAARNRSAKAQVIKLSLARSQAVLQVAQAFSKCQLAERHAEELIPAGESSHLGRIDITSHTTLELLWMNPFDDLREYGFSEVHRPRLTQKPTQSRVHA